MTANLNKIVKVDAYPIKLRLIHPAHNRPHESDLREQTPITLFGNTENENLDADAGWLNDLDFRRCLRRRRLRAF